MNTPTRDSIERALDFAVIEGLIRSWKRDHLRPGSSAKWQVEVHPNVHSADGLGTYPIRTYEEAKLFCAALASARSGLLSKVDAWASLVGEYREALDIPPGADPTEAGVTGDMEMDSYADSFRGNPRLADVLGSALRRAIDLMEGGSADAEHAALYSLCTSVAELLDVSFDSYVSTTDHTGEDD